MYTSSKISLLCMLAATVALTGCATTQGGSNAGSADAKPAAAQSKTPAGMNEKGEVINASKVESGHGRKVKGIGDWEGEITGIPAPKSKFTKLQICMSMKQVTDLAGQPTDSGAYITGKAWIPFYFGSDRYRYEMVYKGMGRLIFAGGSLGNFTGGNLIWIIHSASEKGYRE